jgi:ParB-like chromosome segregation protein Spo0J
VAGGRRLAALQRLAKAKAIAKTEEIACQVINGEDAAEISLACGCRCTPPRSLSS